MVGDEKGEDRLKAVSFAAGTAAFMACIERAVMVSVFVHWRVWVFLALNLLLLAILFTSKYQIPLDHIDGEDFSYAKFLKKKKKKTMKKKRRRECSQLVSVNGGGEIAELAKAVNSVNDETKNEEEEEEDDAKKGDYDDLSEEELNQKVEAFIARFKQHLLSDAKGTNVTS